MKQGEPQLLLNCPKCNSGKLTFTRQDDKTVMLSCLDCAHCQDKFYSHALEAAAEWNKR